ncbi:uncharacterized protein LOC113167512 isoform X1 [Anabas testudineus]|uniref:uncharacterized protein LOC113167510 isoform X1 n=1 Tax=Anabas testudineus TaxID=64144 RepID=UPI000E454AD4|nr:uncharacterized protein LOC113167510 isoform X1 [Anabas testudineus]XP_026223979.1 uncharacterized protein LOC113167512 isoform X1 [Anabas testudineus]
MGLRYVVLFCFFTALWGGNTSITVFQKREMTDFQIQWEFSSPESMKFFCKRECKREEDVLIKTQENRAQSGRYSIEYKSSSSAEAFLYVTIANLTKSDSGRYRFGLGRSEVSTSYGIFDVKVVDAQGEEINIHTGDEGGEVTVVCYFSSSKGRKFFCKNDCKEGNVLIETTDVQAENGRYSIRYGQESVTNNFFLRVTTAALIKSDSGPYTCGLGESLSSASFQRFEVGVINATSKPASTVSSLSTLTPTTHSLRSSSGGSSPTLPETTDHAAVSSDVSHPVFLLPLVICLSVVPVLLAVVLLFLYRIKRNRNSESSYKELVVYENCSPTSTCEASIQNLG